MVSIDLSIETVFIEKTRHLVCKVAILQQLFSNNFWTEISQIGHSAKSALLSYLLRLIWLSDKSAKPQNQENHALSLKTPKSPDVNVTLKWQNHSPDSLELTLDTMQTSTSKLGHYYD